jgi:membrane protein DedA with SNARE-associated domain/rhodanese-related sulfurtransferase
MADTSQFLIKYGAPLLFGAVFVDQMGVPIPALPWLLAAGAFSASARFSLAAAVSLTVMACLIADAIWFYLGRARGSQVLGLLCRISLEPDSCVRRTQNLFTRYGLKGVLLAKFVPGLSTVAPPLAGMSGQGAFSFFLVDGIGALLYALAFTFLGYCFSNQIQDIEEALASIGGSALALLGVLICVYIGFKFWQRQRLLRELRMARITVDELRQKQEAGEDILVLDLRSSAALQEDPTVILGARHVTLQELEGQNHGLPYDRDIVLYCSCPNEVTSARVALALQKRGFTRIRPLKGGIDAWRENKYPVEVFVPVTTSVGAVPTSETNETANQGT